MKTLKYGSKGEDVVKLQTLLNGHGYSLATDGKFGKKTLEAVKDFQSKNGLTADGIVGSRTWAKLLGEEEQDIVIPTEDIKQFSAPHGNMIYGKDKTYSTYKAGGCGVASFAIVQRAYGLCPDGETQTESVQRLGRYSWEHGYRVKGAGTKPGLFSTNGVKATSTGKASAIEAAVRGGKLVILLIKKGFGNGYTGSGHYIVMYGIQGNTALLRDVGSSSKSRQTTKLDTITTGLKSAYIITKR